MTRRRLAAVPDRPQRVVLYVRVSAVMGRGGDEFHSPDVQIGAMQRLTSGMQVVETIDDDIDQTGRTFERAGIARIRKLAEAGAIDAMAVYNVARFGRNTLESLQFLNWLADRGVTILSATEHIDTSTPSGRWMLTNMLAIAEMRSDEIGQEWSNTIHHRARSGRPHGRVPLGYERGDDGKLVPHPVLGPVMRQAFEDYAADRPFAEIRRRLRASTGMTLQITSMKRIFTNRVYLGEVRAGSAVSTSAHEPLVDEVTWLRVQARVKRDAHMAPRLSTPAYALSGLGRCASCQGPANHVRGSDGIPRIYCQRRRDNADYPCDGIGAPPAVDLEEAVRAEVADWIARLRGDVSGAAASRAKKSTVNVAAVQSELRSVRSAIAAAVRSRGKKQISEAAYEAMIAELGKEEAALVEALEAQQQEKAVALPRRQVVALGKRLLELWPEMDGEQRNRALSQLVEKVWISRATGRKQPPRDRIRVDFR